MEWLLIFCAKLGKKLEKEYDSLKKLAVRGLKMLKMRDFVLKMRELTHFQHQITHIVHELVKVVVLLQQKKILMVKVYG